MRLQTPSLKTTMGKLSFGSRIILLALSLFSVKTISVTFVLNVFTFVSCCHYASHQTHTCLRKATCLMQDRLHRICMKTINACGRSGTLPVAPKTNSIGIAAASRSPALRQLYKIAKEKDWRSKQVGKHHRRSLPSAIPAKGEAKNRFRTSDNRQESSITCGRRRLAIYSTSAWKSKHLSEDGPSTKKADFQDGVPVRKVLYTQ